MSSTALSELEWLAGDYGLTTREIEVLQLVLSGKSSKRAAYELGVCVPTIEVHRANIRKKLGVTNTASIFSAVIGGPGRRREGAGSAASRDVNPVIARVDAGGSGGHVDRAGGEDSDMYRGLVNAVTRYAIFLLDPTGVVMSWNPGAQKLKGYEAHEIIGQHFSRFFLEEDRLAGTPEEALRVAEAEGRFEWEGWGVRKDGRLFWAAILIHPIRNAAGDLVRFGQITQDAGGYEAAAEMGRRDDTFSIMMRGVLDYAICTLDPRGRIRSWNAGAERLSGYSLQEAVGKHLSDLYSPQDRRSGKPYASLEIAAQEGSYEDEVWRLHKNGKPYRTHVTIDAINNDRGALVGFVEVAHRGEGKHWHEPRSLIPAHRDLSAPRMPDSNRVYL